MAQFGKVLGAILGIQDTPKITEKTKQYWRDVNIYKDMIHKLEAKGITRERLQKAGLIIPELFEEHVRVSNMGGGPGGILPVIPVLGSSSSPIDQNVTDEQVNTLRIQIQTLQIFPQNVEVINAMLTELERPRAINETPENRQRILRQIRDQYRVLEQDEVDYMNNMDNYSSSLNRPTPEEVEGKHEGEPDDPKKEQNRETQEVNNLLEDYRSARQGYEIIYSQLQAYGITMNPYATADDPTIWDNSTNDRNVLKEKIKKQTEKYNKYSNAIRLKLKQFNRQGVTSKTGTVTRTVRTNKTIDTDPLKRQLLDYFDRPNERQRNRIAVGDIKPDQGGDMGQMRGRVRELIDSLVDEEDIDMNVVRKLREVQDNITAGKQRDGTPLQRLHNLSTGPKPGPNKIGRKILENILIKFASQQNKFALYFNVESQNATKSTKRGAILIPANTMRREKIKYALKNDANAQHMLDIFSYYGINLNGLADNAESWNKITSQINALPENERLEIYNSFAYAFKIFKTPNVVIRKNLNDETDLSKLTEVRELNERMLSQIEREAVFTPEQITAISERFGNMGVNQGHIDAIKKMNDELSHRILAARGTQNLNFGELEQLAQDVKNKMAPEIMAMFQSVADDMDKAGFDYTEFFKFVTYIFQNKKKLAKALFKPKIENIVEIPRLYNQLTTNIPGDENLFDANGDPIAQDHKFDAPIQQIMDMTGVSQAVQDQANREAARIITQLRLSRRRGQIINLYGIYIRRSMREPPRRGGGGGGGDPDPGGDPVGGEGAGLMEIGSRNWRREISVYTFTVVLGLLGYTVKQIKNYLKNLFTKGKVDVIVPEKEKPTDNTTNENTTDTGIENTTDAEIPGPIIEPIRKPVIHYVDPENIFDTNKYNYTTKNMKNTGVDFNNTHDVNYNYSAPTVQKPFKVHIPAFDRSTGAEPIEYTPEIEENSVLADLVDKYNDKTADYNYDIDNKASEDKLLVNETKLRELMMKIEQANQTSLLNEHKFEPIVPTMSVYKNTSSGNIMTYNYISKSPYTASIGADDEIDEMNKQMELYNNKVKSGITSGHDLFENKSKIDQLETNIRHISMNPEEARQLNRSRTLRQEYPSDVRNLMDEVIRSADKPTRKPIDYSKADLVNFPELEKTLKKYNDSLEKLKTNPNDESAKKDLLDVRQKLYDMSKAHAKTSPAQQKAFNDQKQKNVDEALQRYAQLSEAQKQRPNDPNLKKQVDAAYDYYKKVRDSKAPTNNLPDIYDEAKYNEAYNNLLLREQSGAGARTEGELYGLEGHHLSQVVRPDDSIETNYNTSKKDFYDAKDEYEAAIESGADRGRVETLYTNMRSQQLKYKENETTYKDSFNKYYRDLAERGTYLNNDEEEIAPETDQEKEKFRQLQNIEKMIQKNKDAAIDYNHTVLNINREQPKIDFYDQRIAALKDISERYGLANDFNKASTENLNTIQTNDADTVVNLPGQTSAIPDSTDGHDRARFIDPAEYTLFVDTPREAALDQQRFRDFSRVQPFNGLGSVDKQDKVNYNPLLVNNIRSDMRRFGKATKKPLPTRGELKLNAAYEGEFSEDRVPEDKYIQPLLTDTRPSAFGQVYYEDVQVNPYVQNGRVLFTDENKRSVKWRDFENPHSVFHPDYALLGKSQHPNSVVIGDVSRPAGYEYTEQRPIYSMYANANDSELAKKAGVKPRDTGDARTMRNDNLFSRKGSIYDGLNKYQR